LSSACFKTWLLFSYGIGDRLLLEKLDNLDGLHDNYDVILSDVWGVLHNGESPYKNAYEALKRAREAGKTVVLITNSPRRKQGVVSQLDMLGIKSDCYNDIVTSGELTRNLIKDAPKKVFFLGPDRDLQLLDGLDVERVDQDEAQSIVCTGFFDDEVEKPEDYTDMLQVFVTRGIPFICANPDLIVERGERMIPCAGAIAALYKQLGGEVFVAGKPHKPMYKAALDIAKKVRGDVDPTRIIAIGDGMPTDVRGALNYGLDLLFVAHGIHINQYKSADAPGGIDDFKLSGFLAKEGVRPNYWMEWVK
jgi:HAD superfamily hydrolase (TIGR01450 family)